MRSGSRSRDRASSTGRTAHRFGFRLERPGYRNPTTRSSLRYSRYFRLQLSIRKSTRLWHSQSAVPKPLLVVRFVIGAFVRVWLCFGRFASRHSPSPTIFDLDCVVCFGQRGSGLLFAPLWRACNGLGCSFDRGDRDRDRRGGAKEDADGPTFSHLGLA